MTTWAIIVLAFGLAMDCFAVSVAEGAAYDKLKIRHILRMAAFFGFFQGLMPVIGALVGIALRNYISAFDHWIAFILLMIIGIKTIYEALKLEEAPKTPNSENVLIVLTLAVATSIDALIIGVTLSILHTPIGSAVVVIGVITFLMSLLGVYIGKKGGVMLADKAEIAAGVVIAGLGIKILIQHLFF